MITKHLVGNSPTLSLSLLLNSTVDPLNNALQGDKVEVDCSEEHHTKDCLILNQEMLCLTALLFGPRKSKPYHQVLCRGDYTEVNYDASVVYRTPFLIAGCFQRGCHSP